MIRAKFWVRSKEQAILGHGGDVGTIIKLTPVTSGSDENKEFYSYTPSGSIELGTINEKAAAMFSIGQEFYVDFTPAA